MKPWQAAAAGHLAITPIVLAALLLPIGIAGAVSASDFADTWPKAVHGALLISGFVLAIGSSWLAWAWAITHWRIWAYRRVDDIAALKASVRGSLVWPEGHPFERTEIRSRDQALELDRLEASADQRRSQIGTET